MGVGGAGRLKLGIGVGGAGRLKLCTPMLNAAVRTNIRATVFINSFLQFAYQKYCESLP